MEQHNMDCGMGHKKWCIPDLYMKEPGNMPTPSHESITLLNTGESAANVTMELIFDNGDDPVLLEGIQVRPKSARHIRMDQMQEWDLSIPTSVCYSAILKSDRNIVAEYARLNWIDGAAQSFAVMPYFED